jgi:serine/threonine-protein kinase HipA
MMADVSTLTVRLYSEAIGTLTYVGGERSDYTNDELGHLAAKAALPRKLVIDTAQETVALFMHRWAGEKHHLPMDSAVRRAVDKHLESLPIVTAS